MELERSATAVRAELFERCYRKVWAFRAQVSEVWKTPTPGECLEYAFCELAEAIDADLRARRAEDLRSRPGLDTSVRAELAQCAVMVLSAMPDFDWMNEKFRHEIGKELARPRMIDLGVSLRHAHAFIDVEKMIVAMGDPLSAYGFTAGFLGETLLRLLDLLGDDFEAAIDEELESRRQKIEHRQGPVYRYLQHGGVRCLVCDSRNIDGGEIEWDHAGATQMVRCADCGSQWTDVLELVDVAGIEDATKKEDEPIPVELAEPQPADLCLAEKHE